MKNETYGHFTFNMISAGAFAGLNTSFLILLYWGAEYSGTFNDAPGFRWFFCVVETGVLACAVAIHLKRREMRGYFFDERGLSNANNEPL